MTGVVAYLDAGTGSMIVGAVAGIGASVAVAAKAGWGKLARRGKQQPSTAPDGDTPSDVDAVEQPTVADS